MNRACRNELFHVINPRIAKRGTVYCARAHAIALPRERLLGASGGKSGSKPRTLPFEKCPSGHANCLERKCSTHTRCRPGPYRGPGRAKKGATKPRAPGARNGTGHTLPPTRTCHL